MLGMEGLTALDEVVSSSSNFQEYRGLGVDERGKRRSTWQRAEHETRGDCEGSFAGQYPHSRAASRPLSLMSGMFARNCHSAALRSHSSFALRFAFVSS